MKQIHYCVPIAGDASFLHKELEQKWLLHDLSDEEILDFELSPEKLKATRFIPCEQPSPDQITRVYWNHMTGQTFHRWEKEILTEKRQILKMLTNSILLVD